jgi:hypothetical protein
MFQQRNAMKASFYIFLFFFMHICITQTAFAQEDSASQTLPVQKRDNVSLLRAGGVGVFIIGQAESSIGQLGVITPDGLERLSVLPLTKYGWGMFSYIGAFSAQIFLSNNVAYQLSSRELRDIEIVGLTTTFGYRIYYQHQLRIDACLGTGSERLTLYNGTSTGITQIQGSIAASYFIPFVSIPATDGGQPVQLGTLLNARLGYTHRLISTAPPEITNRDLGPGVFLHIQIGLGMWSEAEPPQPNL